MPQHSCGIVLISDDMKTMFIFLLSCLAQVSQSQVNDLLWQNCFGVEGTEIDRPKCVEKTKTGYLISIGLSNYAPQIPHYHAKGEGWIISLDSLGNKIWERCYGGSEGDNTEKIISIDENHFYLFGHGLSTDGDIQNDRPGSLWVVKIDAQGNILWENNYGSILEKEHARDALLTPDGGLIMMCRIMGAGGDISEYFGSNDIWVCRIDSIGNILWETTLGNHALDNALNMIISSQNTLIIVGGHYESGGMITCPDLGNDGADAWIVEMDMGGNLIRQFCYGGSYNDLIWDITEVEDGYIFAASTKSNDQDVSGFHGVAGEDFNEDIWVVKINFEGDIIWQRCLGGSRVEYPMSIFNNSDTSVIIFGNVDSADGDVSNNHNTTGYFEDIWAIELSNNGNLIWEHCFGGGGNDRFWYPHGVVQNNSNDYVILCATNYKDGDVDCELVNTPNAWVFQIKDCSLFMPTTPQAPVGPDTLCITTDSTAIFNISPAAGAWSYEWLVVPVEAGSITSDSTNATLHWASGWEGQAEISVRSWNDCGNSEWSEVKTSWAYSCLGIPWNPVSGIRHLYIFPNPAGDEIHFKYQLSNISYQISIYDLYGRKQAEINIPTGQGQTRIDVSAYPSGIYVAVLKDENGVMARGKFVVYR
jgi:hypothetical protein